jgi:hypothetical protein
MMIICDKKVTSWRDHEALAENYKAIGTNRIYLNEYDGVTDFPWEFVIECKGGASHRMDIPTNINFKAKCPSGIVYSWSFDIEPHSANGSGAYQIDTAAIKALYPKIPKPALASLKAYLLDCAEKIRKHADEQNQWIQKQYGAAAELEALSR